MIELRMVLPSPGVDIMNAVKMSDQLGQTWAEIVGADNIMNSPIGDRFESASLMVASIAGMTAADVHDKP